MGLVVDAILANHDEDKTFQREVCMLYSYKHGVIDVSTNNCAGSVGFNFEKAHESIIQKGLKPDILYMVHTHPHGFYRMSSIDKNMVHSWVIAFGIPIMFLIVCDDKIIYNLCFKDNNTKRIKQFELFYACQKNIHIPACKLLIDLMYGLSKIDRNLTDVEMEEVCKEMNDSAFDLWCVAHNDLINHVIDANCLLLDDRDIIKSVNANPQNYTDNKITIVYPTL